MKEWKNLKIKGIARIEKVVAEFDVIELIKTPYSKFKVKVYEDSNGSYTGYTNLRIKDETGDVFGGVGHGNTIEEALNDTIVYFLDIINEKQIWHEDDFECSDPFDFQLYNGGIIKNYQLNGENINLDYPSIKDFKNHKKLADDIFNNPEQIIPDPSNGEYYFIKGKDIKKQYKF